MRSRDTYIPNEFKPLGRYEGSSLGFDFALLALRDDARATINDYKDEGKSKLSGNPFSFFKPKPPTLEQKLERASKELAQVENEIARQLALPALLLAETPMPAVLVREIVGYDNDLSDLQVRQVILSQQVSNLNAELQPEENRVFARPSM